MKIFFITIILLCTLPVSAQAWRGHHHYHGGSHGYVSFGTGYPAYPYYRPYYPAYPTPVYVEPAPIIVEDVQPYDNYARPVTNTRYDQGYCREYTRNVKINGRIEESYGTACQQPDGSWAVVN